MIITIVGIWLACSVLNFLGLVLLFRAAVKRTSIQITKEKHDTAVKNVRLYTLFGPIGTVLLAFSLTLVCVDELIAFAMDKDRYKK